MVIKHMAGFVITNRAYAGITGLDVFTLTGQVGGTQSMAGASANSDWMAVHPSGHIITAGRAGGFGTPLLVNRINTGGQVVWSVPVVTPTSSSSYRLRTDAAGNTWVIELYSQSVYLVDPNGAVSMLYTSSNSWLEDLQVDAAGTAWFTESTSGGKLLVRIDTAGNVLMSLGLGSVVEAMALDACGQPHVLLNNGGLQRIDVHHPASGAVVASYPLSSSLPNLKQMVMDTEGNHWLRQNGGGFYIVDGAGSYVGFVLTTNQLHTLGDPTGLHLVAAVDPTGDGDLDGVSNEDEIRLGTDPLNAASTPPALTLTGAVSLGAIVNVSCSIPSDAGFNYVLGLSGGTAGIPLAPPPRCLTAPLTQDALLTWWLSPMNPVLGTTGSLDSMGAMSIALQVPSVPLGGFPIYFALGTQDPATLEFSSVTTPLQVILP